MCSGYEFEPVIGTDWINQQPDKWMRSYAELAGELGICAFVHHPERDAATGCLFSTMFAIERGEIVGRHRKITPTPGSESWAQGGAPPVPIRMDGMSIGMLICADAYLPAPTKLLATLARRSFCPPLRGIPESGGRPVNGRRDRRRRGCP